MVRYLRLQTLPIKILDIGSLGVRPAVQRTKSSAWKVLSCPKANTSVRGNASEFMTRHCTKKYTLRAAEETVFPGAPAQMLTAQWTRCGCGLLRGRICWFYDHNQNQPLSAAPENLISLLWGRTGSLQTVPTAGHQLKGRVHQQMSYRLGHRATDVGVLTEITAQLLYTTSVLIGNRPQRWNYLKNCPPK